MSTAPYLLKRSSVFFLIPFGIYLLPTFFYVIIVLSIGKIMHLVSKGYYFRYKHFLHSKNKEKIPRRGITRFKAKTAESMYGCAKIF